MKVFTLAYECVWAVNVEMCHGCVCLPNGCYLAPDCRGTQPIQHHKRYDVLPSSFIALPHSTVQLCDTERERTTMNIIIVRGRLSAVRGAVCLSTRVCVHQTRVCQSKMGKNLYARSRSVNSVFYYSIICYHIIKTYLFTSYIPSTHTHYYVNAVSVHASMAI